MVTRAKCPNSCAYTPVSAFGEGKEFQLTRLAELDGPVDEGRIVTGWLLAAALVTLGLTLLTRKAARALDARAPLALEGLAVAVLGLALLPATRTDSLVNPMAECAGVTFAHGSFTQLYPLAALGAAGSFAGLALAAGRAATGLAAHGCGYFVAVAAFNLCGCLGIMHLGCDVRGGAERHAVDSAGLPFFVAWVSISFATNLVLQKIVVRRAELCNPKAIPACLRGVFRLECVLAGVLCVGSVLATVAAMGGAFRDSTPGTPTGRQASHGSNGAGLASVLAALVGLFALADLAFSGLACVEMRRAVRRIEAQRQDRVFAAVLESAEHRVATVDLDRALGFARLNVLLVLLSVTTTTVYYLALINSFLGDTFGALAEAFTLRYGYGDLTGYDVPALEGKVGVLFVAWLLDSLFNDACVAFVAFGPTGDALQKVGAEAVREESRVFVLDTGMPAGTPTVESEA